MQSQDTALKLSDLQWTILSEIPEAVVVTDAEQHVAYWNGPAEQLYGADAEQTLGRSLESCCPGLWSTAQRIGHRLLAGEIAAGRWSGEIGCKHTNGEELFVNCSITLLRDSSGAGNGLLWIVRDITAQKKLQLDLTRCQELLSAAQPSPAAPVAFPPWLAHSQPDPIAPHPDPSQVDVVLWAEDDDNDAALLSRAWHKAEVDDHLVRVRDGAEVIRYLRGDGAYGDREQFPFPSLLLLDINMPGRSGLEVIEWLQTQSQFPKLPVVILTSSAASRDVHEAARLGVRGYLVKPLNPNEWVFKVKTVTSQCR